MVQATDSTKKETAVFTYATPDFVKTLGDISSHIEEIQSDAKKSRNIAQINSRIYTGLSKGETKGIYYDQIQQGRDAKIAAINAIKEELLESDFSYDEFYLIVTDCLGEKIQPFLNEKDNATLVKDCNKIDLWQEHPEFIAMLKQIKPQILLKCTKNKILEQKLDFLFSTYNTHEEYIKSIRQRVWLRTMGLISLPIICAGIIYYLIRVAPQ